MAASRCSARCRFDGASRDAVARGGVRRLPLGLHGGSALTGPDRQATDHPRPLAARVAGGNGPVVCARRSRSGQHVGSRIDRAGCPVLRCRHDLGQQRHGVRALSYPATGVDRRPARGASRRPGGTNDVRGPDTERAGVGNTRRDGAGQPDDRRADSTGRAGRCGRPRWDGARRDASGGAGGQRRWGGRCFRSGIVARRRGGALRSRPRPHRPCRRRRSGDRDRLESRPGTPVARHAGRGWFHRNRRSGHRRAATGYRGSASPRVRRSVTDSRDDCGSRRARCPRHELWRAVRLPPGGPTGDGRRWRPEHRMAGGRPVQPARAEHRRVG